MIIKDSEKLEDLQCNGLKIIQDDNEYRFTSDAVALANFAKVKPGGRVVDLCSGSGVIGILIGAKNKAKDVTLVEIQETLADMSSRTIDYNHIDNISVLNQPLQGVSGVIGVGLFDVVVCNPPYKRADDTGLKNEKIGIAIARHEIKVTLDEIILEASKLLKFGGDFYTINKEERLTDIMVSMRQHKIEPKELVILRSNKGANVVMIKGKKGGRSGLTISVR